MLLLPVVLAALMSTVKIGRMRPRANRLLQLILSNVAEARGVVPVEVALLGCVVGAHRTTVAVSKQPWVAISFINIMFVDLS